MKIACVAACIALTWLTTTGVPVAEILEPVCQSKFDYDVKLLSKLISMEFNYNKQVEVFSEREKLMNEQLNAFRESSMNLTSKLLSMELNYNKQVESFIEREKLMNEQLNTLRESLINMSKVFGAFKEETFQIIGDLEANSTSVQGNRKVDLTFVRTEIDKLKTVVDNFADPGPVAFAVQEVSNKGLTDGEKVVYSTVLLDTTGAYDNNTGVFTAPRDGVYMFSTQAYINQDFRAGLAIMAGGKQLAIGVRDIINLYSSYTVVGVGQLKQGQEAYVVMKNRSPSSGSGLYDGWARNNFHGVLIHP